ncbi:MAG: hypothetical protein ACLFUB_07855 [Cyclobacteriaceae bacterium]
MPQQAWRDLITTYPNRFSIGSDVFGHFSDLREKIDRYRVLLDRLPEEEAQQLAWKTLKSCGFPEQVV